MVLSTAFQFLRHFLDLMQGFRNNTVFKGVSDPRALSVLRLPAASLWAVRPRSPELPVPEGTRISLFT